MRKGWDNKSEGLGRCEAGTDLGKAPAHAALADRMAILRLSSLNMLSHAQANPPKLLGILQPTGVADTPLQHISQGAAYGA